MKKISVLFVALLICFSLSSCGKSLEEKVTQKQTKVEIGTQVNLVDLFDCEEGVSIAVKNIGSFDTSKVGTYSVGFTITEGDEQLDKSFAVKVTDEKAPDIEAEEEIILYQGDKFDPENHATVSDNSNEEIVLEVVENNVNLNKAGEYAVKYQAKDSSGNKSEKDTKVIVKKVYSFAERKNIVKDLLKNKAYKNLEYTSDNNKKIVWIDFKKNVFSSVEKGNYYYYLKPYLVVTREGKKLNTKLYVNVFAQDKEKYLSPKSLYIRSSKGTVSTDQYTVDLDFEYDYLYSNFSDMTYYFNDEKKLDKLHNEVINGSDVKFTTYTDEYTFQYKCNAKEIKGMKTMLSFYNDLKAYI